MRRRVVPSISLILLRHSSKRIRLFTSVVQIYLGIYMKIPAQSPSSQLSQPPMATCAAIKAAGAQRFVIDINYWLDRVPEGTDSAGAQKRKRAPLEEMSENIASGSAPSTPQAKRARQNAGGPPPVEDDTPRAQNLQLFESNIALRPGSAAAPVQEPEKSSTATTSTSTSSYLDDSQSGASKKRKRSVSPIKSMSALRLLRHTVRNQPIDVVEDLPETFQELALKMEKIKCGEGIIYPERQVRQCPGTSAKLPVDAL